MTRSDFWCRVLGWLQIGGAVTVGAAVYAMWRLLFGWIELDDGGFFRFVMWLVILFLVLPPFLAGLFTVLFANKVEQARQGFREDSHVLMRVFMALAGLWSAGVIGFLGFSVPPLTPFAVLGLATAGIAIMGQEWTADLLATKEQAP